MGEMLRVTTQRPNAAPARVQRSTLATAQRVNASGASPVGGATARREAEARPLQRMLAAGTLQPRLVVGAADDPFEREAERTADAVMTPDHAPALGESGIARTGLAASLMRMVRRAIGKTDPPVKKDEDDKKKLIQKESAGAGPSMVPAGVESSIDSMSAGGGAPLPTSVRNRFEPRFGYDFGSVRTHTGSEAIGAAHALGARAFTVGDNIFFGAGEYQPSSAQGQRLIAHELTHTIQQQPSGARASRMIARAPTVAATAPRGVAPRRVQRLFDDTKAAIRTKVREWIVRDFPPWDLITLIIGYDPIQEKSVKGATRDWIRAAMKLAPDGEALFDRLDKEGKIDSVAKWWDAQIAKLDLSYASMVALVNKGWESVGAADVFDPVGAWNKKLKPLFAPVIDRVWAFIKEVGSKILAVVKDLVLNQLGEWAKKQKGYPLLTMVLGKDPVTGEEVKPTLKGVIFAVLDLVDGGDKIKENLEKSKTIEKAAEWFKVEVKKLDLTWEGIKALFKAAWDAFKVADLLAPKMLFEKMAAIFGPPVVRLLNFLLAVGKKILEFIFDGMMIIAGPIGLQIAGIFKKIGATFNTIVADPIAFVGHLIDGVKKGIQQFAKNIWEHLKQGLIGWLVGALDGAGIVLPKVWDLKGIVDLVLQILGITYAKIRVKLVKVLGEKTVSMLEKAFAFLKTLVTEGPAAAWKEIVDAIGSLWDMVIGGIKDWAVTKIVTAAITKLATMFNPAGAIIQAIIATYNTVAFFIERIKQILAFVEAVVDSIANVANGKIDAAANWIEKAMARSIPVLLGFLARLIGLGNVSEAIKKVITAIQQKVDKGIDFVIDWVVKKAKSLFGGKDEKAEKKDEDPKWSVGVAGVHGEIAEMEKKAPVTSKELDAAIPGWKQKYEFKSLRIQNAESKWTLFGSMSPEKVVEEHKVEPPTELKDLQPEVDYFFPLATAKGKDGSVIDVGEFVELKLLNAEWWVVYLPSKRKRKESGAVKVMTRAFKAGGKEKAYVRAGNPGAISPTLSQGTGTGGRAKWVHAQPLALQGKYAAPGGANPLGWTRLDGSANWIRAHLINGEMGGPGATWNLVPTPSKTNSQMTAGHENPIRKDLEKGKYFFFGADVEYYGDSDSTEYGKASDFAKQISVSYGETDLVPPDMKTFKDSPGGLKSKTYSVPLPKLAEIDPKRRAS